MTEQNKKVIIKSVLNELSKAKYFYDGSNRVTSFYSAPVDTGDNKPCLLTEYTYVGATSYVDAFKESEGVWQAAWDLP